MNNGLLEEIFRNRERIVSLEAKLNHVINILHSIPVKPDCPTECPACGRDIPRHKEQCPDCGQRLKWSE